MAFVIFPRLAAEHKSQRNAGHAEYIKAVKPGKQFLPHNLLLLRPRKSECSQGSDDVRRDADSISPPRDP